MILRRLPIKFILRFESVSKLGYSNTLASSHFAFAHLKFPNPSPKESLLIRNGNKFQIMSYKNVEIDLVNMEVDFDVGDEKMNLVGTCNGLVCLGSHSGRLSILWNPITREFRKYQLETEISNSFGPECLIYWGFGYVSTGDDYKIVRLCMDMSSHSLTVHVYSNRLDTWRVINNYAYDTSNLSYPVLIRTSGLFVNGTLYWRLPEAICSFNLKSDKLDTFPPHLEAMISPPLPYVTFSNMLFVVNGCLSTYGPCRRGNDHIFTILKGPEIVEQIIVPKDVAEVMPYAGILIGFTRSDKIFTQYSRQRLGVIDLSLHPLNLTPLMKLGGRGVTEAVSYCASLISPKSLCYKNVQG